MAELLQLTVFKSLGRFFVVLSLSVFALASYADGMDSARTNVVKAGMINGFAAYTTWPGVGSGQPFVIGVMGGDQHFIPALERFFKRKPIANNVYPQIRSITIEQVKDCQIVVVLGLANEQAEEILKTTQGLPILTISDHEDFTNSGGHVNFFNENNKLRFEINWKSTTQSNLKVSSRLLRLARLVGERP